MLKEFREFAIKGNMIDLAIGVVIGAAFGRIVDSLVRDVIMPPVSFLTGGIDFGNVFFVLREGTPAGPYASLKAASDAGAVTLNLGLFLNSLITFLIVAWALFFVVKAMNRLRRAQEPAPAPPPEPPATEVLLGEIRDILKQKN
ncbi:MAG: large conductance mechanosensitive channel protein MscL [Fimbriimonadaceae bacterium]